MGPRILLAAISDHTLYSAGAAYALIRLEPRHAAAALQAMDLLHRAQLVDPAIESLVRRSGEADLYQAGPLPSAFAALVERVQADPQVTPDIANLGAPRPDDRLRATQSTCRIFAAHAIWEIYPDWAGGVVLTAPLTRDLLMDVAGHADSLHAPPSALR